MTSLRARLAASPALARVLPFGVFALLTVFQGDFGPGSRFWFYLIKTLAGAALLWLTWPLVKEMRWRFSWLAAMTGVAVFVMWVGLDGLYPRLGTILEWLGLPEAEESPADAWNPLAFFGEQITLGWIFVLVRIVGSSIVVPPLEEVFYRSFVYRSVASPNFETEPIGRFAWGPFLITSVLFGVSHQEWLAGILCGFAYQGIVCRTKRLGDAMTAHAITNALLGAWVVSEGAWQFW